MIENRVEWFDGEEKSNFVSVSIFPVCLSMYKHTLLFHSLSLNLSDIVAVRRITVKTSFMQYESYYMTRI